MSFGKLYGFVGNARTTVLLVVARENQLDIEFIETNPDHDLSNHYLKLNPLRLIPSFEKPNGEILTEVIAIAYYYEGKLLIYVDLVASQNPTTTLLGETKEDFPQILRWMSFVNMELQPHLANWFKPLVGRRAYAEERVEDAARRTNRAVAILEDQLSSNTYLTGPRLTLADLLAASSLSRGFQYVFDIQWQKTHPRVTDWFRSVVDQPMWRAVIPNPIIVEQAVTYHP